MLPFTSPDGYRIPAGNWVAIPQVALMRDEKIWPGALAFEGFRFVDEENSISKSRFTHPSYNFPFWGSIRGAW
jgi:cytochrome P450